MNNIERYLFRGVSKESRKWVYGSLLNVDGIPFIFSGKLNEGAQFQKTPDNSVIITPDGKETPTYFDKVYFPCLTPVFQESVGQWTWLNDKNEVRIFDGDLVKDRRGDVFKVEFLNHFQSVHLIRIDDWNDKNWLNDTGVPIFTFTFPKMDLSVVGSIHDHLLEATK